MKANLVVYSLSLISLFMFLVLVIFTETDKLFNAIMLVVTTLNTLFLAKIITDKEDYL